MGRAEIYPFADIGEYHGQRYPDWIRGLKDANGVYLIRERRSGHVAYIGESHSDRLYGTLTRHFQQWSPKWETAGPTYQRQTVDVAVVVVSADHALGLQNDLICALTPRDNRLICAVPGHEADTDRDAEVIYPRGYDYDIAAIIAAVFHDFEHVPYQPEGYDEEIPF